LILQITGKSNRQKDYGVHGSPAEKAFNALGAVAAILVCNTSGMLTEIQVIPICSITGDVGRLAPTTLFVTVHGFSSRRCGRRRCATCGGRWRCSTPAGAAANYGVSAAGYWAYGSAVSEYLPDELGGPRWAVVIINAAARLPAERRLAART